MEKNPDELGALWTQTSKSGDEYLTGTVNGVKVVCFKTRKKEGSNQPDWRVMRSKPKDEAPIAPERLSSRDVPF